MNGIFDTGDGRKLVMYEHGNAVFMSVISREFSGRPILLSVDYEKDLSACILDNKLYYAYIAANHHIKVKSIDDVQTKWEFDEPADNLFLTTYENALILFYTKTKLPETDFKHEEEPRNTAPLETASNDLNVQTAEEAPSDLKTQTAETAPTDLATQTTKAAPSDLGTQPETAETDANDSQTQTVESVADDSQTQTVESVPADLEEKGETRSSSVFDSENLIGNTCICFHVLTGNVDIGKTALLAKLYETAELPKPYTDYYVKKEAADRVNEAVLRARKDYLFSISAELEGKYAGKEQKLKTYYAEQLAQSEESIRKEADKAAAQKIAAAQKLCSEQLTEKEAELTRLCEERIAEKEKKIKELNSTISKIKLQYEQLMKTARSYKEDAAKWHSLYHNRGR